MKLLRLFIFVLMCWPCLLLAGDSRLAVELAGEMDHAAAALEFRRLAFETADPAAQGAWLWAAARQYLLAGDFKRAENLVDKAEDASSQMQLPTALLRSELAVQQKDFNEADFNLGIIDSNRDGDADWRRWAKRSRAVLMLRQGDPQAARAELAAEVQQQTPIETYMAGSDKSPRLGGALGLVPGLGYAYSGEYANGLRSLILNSIFIFGMVETAEEELWGPFAVITFFEFTWYSGSIYGGLDAAHRFNRSRLQHAVDEVSGGMEYEADYSALPAVKIRFKF